MYLDFLQNRPDATIAGVYSLRPKPGATVSMPLSWDEVKPGLTMRHFTIHNSMARLRETGDLFKGVLGEGHHQKSTKHRHGLMIDMDGVIYAGEELIKKALLDKKIPFTFLSDQTHR
jgi:DNA primase